MSTNIRKCNSCNSDTNWNYCCKVSIQKYVSSLEMQVNQVNFDQNKYNNEIIMLRSKTEMATVKLEYESLKAFIMGFCISFLMMQLYLFFR